MKNLKFSSVLVTLPILTLLISFLSAASVEAGEALDGGHHRHRPSPPRAIRDSFTQSDEDGGHHRHRPSPPRRRADISTNTNKEDAIMPLLIPDGGHHRHRPSPPGRGAQ